MRTLLEVGVQLPDALWGRRSQHCRIELLSVTSVVPPPLCVTRLVVGFPRFHSRQWDLGISKCEGRSDRCCTNWIKVRVADAFRAMK